MTDIMSHPSAWPFLKPVDPNEVPDYYEVIKNPIGTFLCVWCVVVGVLIHVIAQIFKQYAND